MLCAVFLSGCINRPRQVPTAYPPPAGENQRAAIVLPPPPALTLSWLNGNTGDTDVVTGIQSSVDQVNWQTICVTNCDTATNFFTVPITQDHEFFRAFTDFKSEIYPLAVVPAVPSSSP